MDWNTSSIDMAPRTRRFLYELTGVEATPPTSASRKRRRQRQGRPHTASGVSAALAACAMLVIAGFAVSLAH